MDEEELEQLRADIESHEAYCEALSIGYLIWVPIGLLILALVTWLGGK